MTKRTTIYLDEALAARAQRVVPGGQLDQLVNELLAERLTQLENAELEAQMREGYLAVEEDRRAVNEDWQALDGEGWPG